MTTTPTGFCPSCGAARNVGAFCGSCGKPYEAAPAPTPAWTADSQAPVGSLCGRCGKPLSPVWRGKCSHCGTPYTVAAPVTNAPTPGSSGPATYADGVVAATPKSSGHTGRNALLVVAAVIAIAVVALMVGGRPRTPTTGGNGGGGTTTANRSQYTVSGVGIMQSTSVPLEGDYTVQWQAQEQDSDTPDIGCYHGARLEPVGGGPGQSLVSVEVKGQASGTSAVYGVDGPAYVDASSGCKWSFTFVPS